MVESSPGVRSAKGRSDSPSGVRGVTGSCVNDCFITGFMTGFMAGRIMGFGIVGRDADGAVLAVAEEPATEPTTADSAGAEPVIVELAAAAGLGAVGAGG